MITLIGDVHGLYIPYLGLIKQTEYSVQLGDFGFNYNVLNAIDSDKHKLFFGNHDEYSRFYDIPHNLGHYGLKALNDVKFFFVRGGFSIDWRRRNKGTDWFEEEELDLWQQEDCFAEYLSQKPNIVLSHECPLSCVKYVTTGPEFLRRFGYVTEDGILLTKTNNLLQAMLEYHQPEQWFFGHYHVSKSFKIDGCSTQFTCLNELETYELKG